MTRPLTRNLCLMVSILFALAQSGCYIGYWGDADWEWYDECDWDEDDDWERSEGWADNDSTVTEPAQNDIDQAGAEALDALQRSVAGALARTDKLADPGPRRRAVMIRRQQSAVSTAYSNVDARMRTRFGEYHQNLDGALSAWRTETMESPWHSSLRQARDRALADLEQMAGHTRMAPKARAPIAGECLLCYTDPSGDLVDAAIARLTLHRDFRVTGELLSGRIGAQLDNPDHQSAVRSLGPSRPIMAMRWHEVDGRVVLVAGSYSISFDSDGPTRRRYRCAASPIAPAELFVGYERRLAASDSLRAREGSLTLRRTDP